jgi:hypothetical protein
MNPLDFLSPINTAVTILKNLLDSRNSLQDRTDRENTSMAVDLIDLLSELSKTHAMIVKLVSPLRRISDNLQTFANDFIPVYNDFRDIYDALDFVHEHMRCGKIGQIHSRMRQRKPRFGSQAQWDGLNTILYELASSDAEIIDRQYRPFMKRFDKVMRRIEQHVKNNQIAEAIAEKNAFLNSLGPDYDQNKAMLEEMTDGVGKLIASL